jgi:hypothetical protein
MSERERKFRTAVVTYFPMFIAVLSLVTSIYNGYLNAKFVDIIQSNFGRGEYLRTCKEVIDAYFQIKARVELVRTERERAGGAPAAGLSPYQAEAIAAVSRFGALGTYLANLRDDKVRARYTELTGRLDAIVREAGTTSNDLRAALVPADAIFNEMNDDCIKSAKDAPM